MKRKIFTIIMMLALVIMAGSAIAQTKWTPIPGSTHTYVMKNLNNGDEVDFAINNSDSTWSSAVIDATIDAAATVVEGDSAWVTITWGCSITDADSVLNLWISVSDGTCSNYRYRSVTITPSDFDLTIYALGTSPDSIYTGWSGNTDENTADCQVFIPGTNDFAYDVDDDGESFLFFRVVRVDGTDGEDWSFSVDVTVIPSPTIEYYNGSTWSGTAPTGLASTVTEQLVRVKFDNDPAGYADVVGTVDGEEGDCPNDDSVDTNDTDTITISPMPDLDSVTFE